MSNSILWSRMLWKLRREAGSALWIAIIMPPIALLLSRPLQTEMQPWAILLRFMLEHGSMLAVIALAVAFVASRAALETRQGALASDNLPVPAVVNWAQGFLLPALVTAVVSAWIGACALAVRDIHPLSEFGAYYLAMWVAVWIAAVGLAYLFGATASLWAGSFAGTFMGMFLVMLLAPMREAHQRGRLEWGPDNTFFLAALSVAVLGVVLGGLIFTVITARKAMRVRRLAAGGFAALTAVLSLGTFFGVEAAKNRPGAAPVSVVSDDGSLRVMMHGQSGGPGGGFTEYQFRDLRDGYAARQGFELYSQPVGFLGRRIVLIAESPGLSRDRIRFVRWDTASGNRSTMTTIRLPRALRLTTPSVNYRTFEASMQPEGRYAMLATASPLGEGNDIWMLDLRTGGARIVALNQWSDLRGTPPTWVGDTAVISYGDGHTAYDGRTGTSRRLRGDAAAARYLLGIDRTGLEGGAQ